MHITDPQCWTTIIIVLPKLRQYHTIYTIGPISRRYHFECRIGFNVEITLQSRDKRSASGGLAPRPSPGALPLDPAAALPFQVPQAPTALFKKNWLGVEDYAWLMDKFIKQHTSP